MALYMIGLGLTDEKDITVKGLEAVKKCDVIYLEYYTSKLTCSVEALEKFYGKKIILADRAIVEQKAEETILKEAQKKDIAFLVIGDPFGATTHIDLRLRAKKLRIAVKVIHNASILTAVGITGLELYKFGKTTSIPFHNEKVTSPIEILNQNQKNRMHTLFLLDLDPVADKYMTISEASEYLLKNKVKKDTLCIGCAALGSGQPEIKAAALEKMQSQKFTKFPQCLIIPSEMHFMEQEALELWK
jgi:diphthine synthase